MILGEFSFLFPVTAFKFGAAGAPILKPLSQEPGTLETGLRGRGSPLVCHSVATRVSEKVGSLPRRDARRGLGGWGSNSPLFGV